jgi:hypothetical protein
LYSLALVWRFEQVQKCEGFGLLGWSYWANERLFSGAGLSRLNGDVFAFLDKFKVALMNVDIEEDDFNGIET